MKQQNRVVVPVDVAEKPREYRESMGLEVKEELEQALRDLGVDVWLESNLKGGTISQVYQARLGDLRVVVKHTEDLLPFDPTELYLLRESHVVDVAVRGLLQESKKVRVPKRLHEFPEIGTSVMEDLSEAGYGLLAKVILDRQLTLDSARPIGRMLAELAMEARNWREVVEVQTKEMSIYERGLELRLAYPNSQTQYLELEKLFVRNASYWSWPDAHPKNILVKEDGSCAFIDFGFSQRGDQRFMLATFLAHIMLYSLAGYVAFDIASKYILECVGEYGCVERAVDEGIFCRYLAMEVLHRANGKWIAGVEKAEDKTRCALFGMKVFDEKMARVDSLIDLLEKVLRVN